MRPPLRALVIWLALTFVAIVPAAAQLTAAGLAWGTPAAQVRARLEGLGWRFRGVDQYGDQVYGGARGSEAVATLASGRLVGVDLSWPGTIQAVRSRHRVVTDSLRRVLGSPGERDETSVAWERGDTSLHTWHGDGNGGSPAPMAGLAAHGPGYHAERRRRSDAERAETERVRGGLQRPDSLLAGDWMIVYGDTRVLTRLDSAGFTPAGQGRFRARIREDWMYTRRLENGMMYTAAVRELEIDCRTIRARLLRTVPAYDRRSVATGTLPDAVPGWASPAPGSPEAKALRRSCELMRGA